MNVSFDITSIGCLAGMIQVPCRELTKIAAELGITPSSRINGIPHFSADDVERIATHIRTAGESHPHVKH